MLGSDFAVLCVSEITVPLLVIINARSVQGKTLFGQCLVLYFCKMLFGVVLVVGYFPQTEEV